MASGERSPSTTSKNRWKSGSISLAAVLATGSRVLGLRRGLPCSVFEFRGNQVDFLILLTGSNGYKRLLKVLKVEDSSARVDSRGMLTKGVSRANKGW